MDTVDAKADGNEWRRMVFNELEDQRRRAKEGNEGIDKITDTLPVIDSEEEEERETEWLKTRPPGILKTEVCWHRDVIAQWSDALNRNNAMEGASRGLKFLRTT